jgi:hypothetical protein
VVVFLNLAYLGRYTIPPADVFKSKTNPEHKIKAKDRARITKIHASSPGKERKEKALGRQVTTLLLNPPALTFACLT